MWKYSSYTMFRIYNNKVLVPMVCSILFLVIFANVINAFNLENRLPIVKYGDFDTYFGYSVASHVIGERDGAGNTNWWDNLFEFILSIYVSVE